MSFSPAVAAWIVLGLVLLTLFLVFVLRKHAVREGMDPVAMFPGGGWRKPGYSKPGMPAVPLDIPIPEGMPKRKDGTYISYPGTDIKSLCPSPPGTHCGTYLDCGPAELCVDQAGWIVDGGPDQIQPQSSVCICSVQNPCVTAGNIC